MNRKTLALLIAAITAGIAALGVIKSVLEVGAGKEFSLQQAGYYVGATAITLWAVYVVTLLVAGALVMGIEKLVGGEPPDWVAVAVFIVAGLVGLWMAVSVIFAGVLFDYEGSDPAAQSIFALLGLAALVGGAYAWYALSRNEKSAE